MMPIQLEGYDPTYKGHQDKLKRLQPYIKNAKRVLTYCRCRCIKNPGAMAELLKHWLKRLKFPVANTLVGLVDSPGNHELALVWSVCMER